MDSTVFDSLIENGRKFFKSLPFVLLALIIVSGLSVFAAYNCGVEHERSLDKQGDVTPR